MVDAAFNILIGFAIDKTHSRYGKLRPWLLYGSIPLGFLTVLCFVPFGGEAKFYFALISYTIYCLAYTAVNTPYSALTNRLTQHEASRSSLSVYRFVLAIVGYLIVSTTADRLISPFSDKQLGYVFAVSCFALLATFLFLACFGMTKERVGEEEEETPVPTLREMLKAVAGNAPLINLSMFTVFFYIAYTVWMAIAIYFIKYIIGSEGFTSTFFMIQSAAYIVGTVISEKIIALIGKKENDAGGTVDRRCGRTDAIFYRWRQYLADHDRRVSVQYYAGDGFCFNVVNDCRYRGICRVAPWGAHRRRNLRFL